MPATDPRIRVLTDQFVADLTEVIHEAALEAAREALEGAGATARPKRGRKRLTVRRAAKPGRTKRVRKVLPRKGDRVSGGRQRRSAQDVDDIAGAVHACVRANPGSSVGEIGEALKLTTKALRLPIQKLLLDGKLRTEGEKRGTRYFAGTGGARKEAPRKTTGKKRATRKASR